MRWPELLTSKICDNQGIKVRKNLRTCAMWHWFMLRVCSLKALVITAKNVTVEEESGILFLSLLHSSEAEIVPLICL